MTYGKRPPLDEQKSLWESTVAAEGTTTGAGAVTGDSFIDSGLIGAGATSFVSMLAVLYPGEPTNVDSMDITAFNNVTGEVTLAKAYKGVAAAIPAGVAYKIVTFRFVPAEVAALTALVTAIKAVTDVIPDAGALTALLADITAILADTGELQTDWADGGRLDLLIDAIKAVTDALPDAGALNDLAAILEDTGTTLPAILATIAGYLDTEIAAIKAVTDVIPDAGALTALLADITAILADTGELQTDWADGGRLDLLIDAIKAVTDALPDAGALNDLADILADTVALEAGRVRMLFTMDFWSLPQEEVALTNVAGDKALPSVVVAELPAGATIVRAIAMFKFRMIEAHTYAGANKLNGAQQIQVKEAGAGAWTDAINFVDDMFTLAQDTREGGDVIIGAIDVSAVEVDANDTYSFQWDEAVADQDGIKFNDVQMGIRIWYSI